MNQLPVGLGQTWMGVDGCGMIIIPFVGCGSVRAITEIDDTLITIIDGPFYGWTEYRWPRRFSVGCDDDVPCFLGPTPLGFVTTAESTERRRPADGRGRSRLDPEAAPEQPLTDQANYRDFHSDGNSSVQQPRSPSTSGDDGRSRHRATDMPVPL